LQKQKQQQQQQEGQESNNNNNNNNNTSISLRQTKPVSYAFKVLNSQETKKHYKIRMKYFFDYLALPGKDVEEQALSFINNATTARQQQQDQQ
jgi:hypothetical protein